MKLPIFCSVEMPEFLKKHIQFVCEKLVLEKSQDFPDRTSFFLYEEKGLSFVDESLGELYLDFIEDHIRYQRKGHRGKSELIVKALGLEKKTDLVIDATVGLAADALFLVQLGYSVIGFERSPIVYLLLQDAIHRWNQSEKKNAGNFQVAFGDSKDAVLLETDERIRAIYIDPMFPEKKKTALPRKEMQIFKKWVGEDSDGSELLESALKSRAERVIVKRPLKAEFLKPGVVHSFKGTTVRYDLYTPRS